MPSLSLCGRLWPLATSLDLPAAAAVGGAANLVLASGAAALAVVDRRGGCVPRGFAAAITCTFAAQAAIDAGLVGVGFLGKPLETARRDRPAAALLYTKTIIYALQLALAAYAIAALVHTTTDEKAGCLPSRNAAAATLTLALLALVASVSSFAFCAGALPSIPSLVKWAISAVRLVSPSTAAAAGDALTARLGRDELSRLVSSYTRLVGGTDVTASEQALGLALLHVLQRRERRAVAAASAAAAAVPHRPRPPAPARMVAGPQPHDALSIDAVELGRGRLIKPAAELASSPLSPRAAAAAATGVSSRVPASTLRTALAYARFAAAAYGETAFRQIQGVGRVRAALTLHFGQGDAWRSNAINAPSVGTSAAGIRHNEAVLRVAGLVDRDRVYVSRDNAAAGLLPYYVALLRPSKVVILAVRGTGSLADLATDVAALPVDASEWAPPEARQTHHTTGSAHPPPLFTAHAGVLAAADALWGDLEAHGVLNALLDPPRAPGETASAEHPRSAAAAAVTATNLGTAGWRLVVTGHSLGAGVAALVTCRLRAAGRAADCWAFAPLVLASQDLAAACTPFVTSVAVGKDAIPRLSLPTLNALLDGAVVALARCALPAPAAVAALACRRLWPPTTLERALFVDADAVPPSAAAAVAAFRAASRARGGPTLRPELAPPGGLLLVRRLKTTVPGPATGVAVRYDAAWAPPTALLEEGLLVSRRAVSDHFVGTLLTALEAAAQHAEEEGAEEQDGVVVVAAAATAETTTAAARPPV